MLQQQKAFGGMVFTNSRLKSDMKKVYVVDDKFEVLLSLSRWFMSKGCYVKTFSQSEFLFNALNEALPDMIVMNMHLQKEDPDEVCRQIKMQYPAPMPVVLFSTNTNGVTEAKDKYADYLIAPSAVRKQVMSLLLPPRAAYSY